MPVCVVADISIHSLIVVGGITGAVMKFARQTRMDVFVGTGFMIKIFYLYLI